MNRCPHCGKSVMPWQTETGPTGVVVHRRCYEKYGFAVRPIESASPFLTPRPEATCPKRVLPPPVSGDVVWLYFSFKGRVGRSVYWLAYLIPFTLIRLLIIQAHKALGIGGSLLALVSLLFVWPTLAVHVKRWHDRNKSGWWILINLIPLIGPVWSLVELGFLPGTRGPNRFGPDPLAAQGGMNRGGGTDPGRVP